MSWPGPKSPDPAVAGGDGSADELVSAVELVGGFCRDTAVGRMETSVVIMIDTATAR